ncbi:MAG: cytidylate kinase family protein [Candidatus Aenigmarchaeota archaeon]|nr:cytidylate kinase family protein [Candidatus Aenigmarchaeota archaeon]RLI97207.1 MAG: hypothetical protein DRO96_01135 [Candidatus Aenigmarchaeota archaeon]
MSGQTGEEMKNENQTGEKEKRGRTIVVSGMPGCGSSTTAELLAKKLKMDFFSLGKYTKKQFQDKGETQSAIKQWSTDIGSSKEFHQKSDAMQQSLAKHGNIVIESKLGIHFIGKLADLKVWLEAPIHVRAQRYAKRDNLKYDEALEMLEKKEAIERRKWKEMYGFDYFDQRKDADLVIDTSDKTPEEIVDQIIRMGKLFD